MSSDMEADLVRQLREAAEAAVQPAPQGLYAGAVGRGRRIRRRVRIKRVVAGAATLGVVAAVGVPLLGGASTTTTGTAAASTTRAAAGSTRTAAPTPTPPSTAWMPAYVEQTLKSLLPAGSTTVKEADLGGVSLQVFAPEVQAPGGQSLAVVRTDLETPNGKSTISLSVGSSAQDLRCPSKAVAPHDVCTKTPVAGGTFYVDKSFKDYTHGTGVAIWSLAWNGPDGQGLYLGMSSSAPAQALTVPQAQALLTAAAWERVWKALPAPCRYGVMSVPHPTRTQVLEQANLFVCATSPAAAQHAPE
ncbi:hypothetical protein ACEZCY_05590 [Streptacidiphilus sp. N1-12]|uniref:Uncharacterized protein n=2 Tax=Streptacidiphilus alkalitolerans TaxID=3342712 RepID=A0ABV6W9H9_9ACTN